MRAMTVGATVVVTVVAGSKHGGRKGGDGDESYNGDCNSDGGVTDGDGDRLQAEVMTAGGVAASQRRRWSVRRPPRK